MSQLSQLAQGLLCRAGGAAGPFCGLILEGRGFGDDWEGAERPAHREGVGEPATPCGQEGAHFCCQGLQGAHLPRWV